MKWVNSRHWYKTLFPLIMLLLTISANIFLCDSYAAGRKVTCFVTNENVVYCREGEYWDVTVTSTIDKSKVKRAKTMPFSMRYPCFDSASFDKDMDFQLVFLDKSLAISTIEGFERIDVSTIIVGRDYYYAFEWKGMCVVLPSKRSEGSQSFLQHDRYSQKGCKASYHNLGLLLNEKLYGMVIFTDRCIVTGSVNRRKEWHARKPVDLVHVNPADKHREVDFSAMWEMSDEDIPPEGLARIVRNKKYELFRPVLDVMPDYSMERDFKYDWVLPLGTQKPEECEVWLFDSNKNVQINGGTVLALLWMGTWNGAGTRGYNPDITTRTITKNKFLGFIQKGKKYYLQGFGDTKSRSRDIVFRENEEITPENPVNKYINITIHPEPLRLVENKAILEDDPSKGVFTKEITKKYKLVEKIGSGADAEVYSAHLREGGDGSRKYAVRVTALPSSRKGQGNMGDDLTLLRRESLVIQKLIDSNGHRNVAKFYDVEFDAVNVKLCTVMDIYSKGLTEYIKEQGGKLAREKRKKIVTDVCKGLNFLHQLGILHRDIKEDNIMMSDDGGYVITDFGFSHFLGDTYDVKELDNVFRGTPFTFLVNPEIIEQCYENPAPKILAAQMESGFSYREDAYAVWCLLVKLGAGQYPSKYCSLEKDDDKFFKKSMRQIFHYRDKGAIYLLLRQIILEKWILSDQGKFSLCFNSVKNNIKKLCCSLDMDVCDEELDFMDEILRARESEVDQHWMQKMLHTDFLRD